jgi:hypothetical protein
MDQEKLIPAISVRQPWAELILRGEKTIEIRNWSDSYRGDLYLHTGKMADGYKIFDYGMPDVFRGGYIGVIELSAIIPFTPESWRLWQDKHLSAGQYTPGKYAWIIRNPRRFVKPILGPGKLGIFQPDLAIMQQLKEEKFMELGGES